jgi:hypothetical protein
MRPGCSGRKFPTEQSGPVAGLRWSRPSGNCVRDAQSADSRNRRREEREILSLPVSPTWLPIVSCSSSYKNDQW